MILANHSQPESDAAPWRAEEEVRRTVFAVLWSTGPDTTLDRVFRLQALRRGEGAPAWERFDRLCHPADGDASTAEARFGLSPDELSAAAPPEEAWSAFRAFIGDGPVLVADPEGFRSWWEHFEGPLEEGRCLLGLNELADLLAPGRLSGDRHGLLQRLTGEETRPPDAEDLRAACATLAKRFLELDETALAVVGLGYELAWRDLRGSDPAAARRLSLSLSLLESPAEWSPTPLTGGRLEAARRALNPAGELAHTGALGEGLLPRWTREWKNWQACSTVPVRSEEPTPFDPGDLEVLDALFREHLPALFGAEGEGVTYREGQHQVARRVAEMLGGQELLLVHAPTGTGKTLAYLAPAVLWARRHDLRVGVSTYTRALQEQAMDRELPRVLAALTRAGLGERVAELRVAVLKGRGNYLCWRALGLHQPGPGDGAETWLAWIQLLLFALSDPEGDLDRFPRRPALRGSSPSSRRRELETLLRQVRAGPQCCKTKDDRATCGAELARKRSERCHLVITNHAFVLSRPEWFKYLVFDECEHLHEVAHGAWSHILGFADLRGFLSRLHQPDRPASRAPLDRLMRHALPGSKAADQLERLSDGWRDTRQAIEELQREVRGFKRWRDAVRRERAARDEHSLLREFVAEEDAAALIDAHRELTHALDELDSGLAELSEVTDTIPAPGIPRLRRALDLLRIDLAEHRSAVTAWLPREEGRPAFQRETFYDVEEDERGGDLLAARVLLPNEYLGRHYYPQLASAVFLSATTWLRGGFEAALGYLGLDRAAEPHPEEVREPCTVATFRAPDPFDYGRVLVCVPKDAPAYAADRERFRAWVRDFLARLGEETRGRLLVLFTNAEELRRTGEELAGFFRARGTPFWYQGMPGRAKEELGELFRTRVNSILFGVDTFWFGADFPGETLEYLVVVKLPYGVPDRYHHAQCAVLGAADQRRRIYMPRALAKFRQGFGRLMRKESDRGAVFLLDGRILDPRHRIFLRELPLTDVLAAEGADPEAGARKLIAETERCIAEALAHVTGARP